jgi:hypothetical protein
MPLLGATGGGSAKGFGALANLGYFIRNSLRFRSSASARLTRTFGSATDYKIQTFSAWVKRGLLSGSTDYRLMGGYDGSSSNSTEINFNNDTLRIEFGGAANNPVITTQVFRDPSAWYHIVIAIDTTQATASNRVKMYVNGTQITSFGTANYPSQNALSQLTSANANNSIGSGWSGFEYFDGYMAEINFIDGQALTPSSFGKTDTLTNQWIPKKFAGTYGTNGFYLKFADASAATAAAIGKDSSPNGNNWTPNNISVTAGTTYDAMIDSPTLSATASNFCVLNPLDKGTASILASGNLNYTTDTSTTHSLARATFGVSTGKWYWEVLVNSTSSANLIGIANQSASLSQYAGANANSWGFDSAAMLYYNATGTSYGSSYTTGDIIGVALDMDAGTLTYYKNGTSLGQAFSSITGTIFPALSDGGGGSTSNLIINFGQRPFAYTLPSGFKSLNAFNLP